MRIMTKNIIEDNSSISMTNIDVNYPVENIYSNMLEEIAQSSASSTVLTIDFADDQSADSIFFGFHNASSITFVFKNSAGTTIGTETFIDPAIEDKLYFTKLTTIRSIEITMVTGEATVFVGNISTGVYTQLHNIVLPMVVEHVDTSVFNQTDGAQFLYRTGVTVQSFNVDCDKITDAQLSEFESAYAEVHKGKTWWMDRNEELDTQIFGAFDANYHTTRVNTLTDLSFSFKESR